MPTTSQNYSFSSAAGRILSSFPERAKQIVEGRYGIGERSAKTLDEIGKEFQITRERVRQIIFEVIRKVRGRSGDKLFAETADKIVYAVKEKNGIIKRDDLLISLAGDDSRERGAVSFFLDVLNNLVGQSVKDELDDSVSLDSFDLNRWREIKNDALIVLREEKRTLEEEEFIEKITIRSGGRAGKKELLDYLAVASEVKRNQFGKWGLAEWPEISPRGTKEKAYLVLKEAGAPLYFREIAARIDRYGLNRKKTNPQTVHNELIKDDRFVLIGRGIYALAEWGYKRGTVKDLIEDILAERKKPMSKDEILKQILDRRQVKKSTIIINLNNFFQRVGKDEYILKQK